MSLFSSLLVVLIRDVLMFHRAVDPALYIRFLAASWILVYVIIKRMHLAWVKQYNITVCHFIFTLRVFFFFFFFDKENFLSFYNWTARQRKKKKTNKKLLFRENIFPWENFDFILQILCLCLQITIQVVPNVLLKSYRIVCTNTRPICLWKCQSM